MNSARLTIGQKLLLLHQQSVGFAVMLLDSEGRIDAWFAGATAVFGYEEHEVLGRPSSILFTPEDVARGIPDQEMEIVRQNGNAENDRWLVRKDGARFWAMGMLLPIRDA